MTAPAVFATSAHCRRCDWAPSHRTHDLSEADRALAWMEKAVVLHDRTHRKATP